MAHNPQEVSDRWASRIGQSTPKVTAGVQSPRRSPPAAAAASADKWQARVSDPSSKQKFVSRLQSVSQADWTQAMISKGIPRMASGANDAKGKFAAFLSSFLPFQEGITTQVNAMPSNTLEDNINRMIAQVRGTARYRRGQ